MAKRLTYMMAVFATVAMPVLVSAEPTVSIADPAALVSALKDMGYKPGQPETATNSPTFIVAIGDQPTRITFGGCVERVNCKYIYMSSSYSDVPNPPAEWLRRMNDAFDIIKVGTDADNDLFFSATHIIEGVPRSTLRMILDLWIADAAALAEDAVAAKLNKGR